MKSSVDTAKIPNQVKLPIRVAFGVVIQGLRIRLGRSLVTITGVTCGIAFLMSILTGNLVKSGVTDEDTTRAEVGRIFSFVRSELPKLQDKTISIFGTGNLSEVETRVIESLAKDFGVKSLTFDASSSPTPLRTISSAKSGNAADADVIFVMGSENVPAFDWKSYIAANNNRVVASTVLSSVSLDASETNVTASADAVSDISSKQKEKEEIALKLGVPAEHFTQLAHNLTPEELSKNLANKRKERFRAIWIGVISLLVTVIGIANAMLMSVTERFREIGTMKCLGALSSFVTQMFVLEASLMGFVGGVAGALFGALFAIVIYTFTYGTSLVFGSLPLLNVLMFGGFSVIAGVVLSVIAALYPARVAASMVPATALRSTI